jgi:hypothetical protein
MENEKEGGEKTMDKKADYTECELKYIKEAGLSASAAAEICANDESRSRSEKKNRSSDDFEGWSE